MGWCTIYSNSQNFVTRIYEIEALLKALSWWCILTVYRAETDPRGNLDVFFFKQLDTGLQIVFSEVQTLWKKNNKACECAQVKGKMLELSYCMAQTYKIWSPHWLFSIFFRARIVSIAFLIGKWFANRIFILKTYRERCTSGMFQIINQNSGFGLSDSTRNFVQNLLRIVSSA